MIKLLLLLLISFGAYSQDEAPKELTLEEQAAQEAKIREEVLRKYRVKDESEQVSDSQDSIEKPSGPSKELKEKIDQEGLDSLLEKTKDQFGKIEDSFLSNMMPTSMKDVIGKFLKTNPFSKLPREDVKSMITSQTEGKPIGEVLKNNPSILEFAVDWIRDPKALPAFMGMANKPDTMKNYGIVVLIIFILSFILNMLNKSGSLIKRIFKKLLITFGALTINIGLFFWFFKDEIGPTVEIAKKHFF